MSARVYFMKRVKDCKDVSIMSNVYNVYNVSIMNSEDGQVYSACLLQFSCFTKYNNRMQSKHKQTKCEHNRQNSYRLLLSKEVSLY